MRSPWSLLFLAFALVPVLAAALADGKSFYYPVGVYSFALSWTGLPLIYPLICVAVFLARFSAELRDRWIVYTRPRADLRAYLWGKVAANALSVFVVFFTMTFLTYLFVFHIQPGLGWIQYDTYEPGAIREPEAFARMTELLGINDVLFGLAYSAWSGANAIVWATLGFAFVLIVRNRFVALSLPFVTFIVLGFAMGAVGGPFAQNDPWSLWMLFSYSQVPFGPTALTLLAFLLVTTGIASASIWRSSQRQNLQ